jgi:hypothetical protein
VNLENSATQGCLSLHRGIPDIAGRGIFAICHVTETAYNYLLNAHLPVCQLLLFHFKFYPSNDLRHSSESRRNRSSSGDRLTSNQDLSWVKPKVMKIAHFRASGNRVCTTHELN